MSPQDAAGQTAPATTAGLTVRSFWYVVCESHELGPQNVLSRKVLDEDLAIFRGPDGKPVALRDRCMHRAAPLSKGSRTPDGCLRCPYHGWTYDGEGEVVAVPCEKGQFKKGGIARRALVHEVCEQDDFVYVRVRDEDAPEKDGPADITPFAMPCYGDKGYTTVRLQNRMMNNVTNCAENFIDIPHTVFVHPVIFRDARDQKINAHIVRKNGEVHVNYEGETDNLGWFKWFLNPGGHKIQHTDSFFMPNVTSVSYVFGPKRHFIITSQSVPVTDEETLVYTDLTFNYGIFSWPARFIVRRQGQMVIDQDVEILGQQMDVIKKYGDKFAHTQADTIHIFVEQIRDALAEGQDPRTLPEKSRDITFWI